jgi:two-component system CheB/CheR fusion protein
VTLKNIGVDVNGARQTVNVTIEFLRNPAALQGLVMIVFTDVATPAHLTASARPKRTPTRLAELEQELQQARLAAQTIREGMQTSQEELKSTNEEMQSMNEELQSTNEELTTSKEEMQSMNEELHTVNQELQTRLDELSRTNNDMKNLLDSTDIATLFLDNALCVRRFTSETSKVTRLIPADIGRPVSDIASVLLYPDMVEDARQVLRTLVQIEKQVAGADGRWFVARILPYRTLENMIDGVVITFIDVTVSRNLEVELRATEARLREMLESKAGTAS